MRLIDRSLFAFAAVILLVQFSGCCCSCGGSNWLKSLVPPPGANGNNNNPLPPALDPAASEELAKAREYSQKALTAKGYGMVNSVDLSKDGLNWYVTGTVSDLAGGNPDYSVWFEVKRVGNTQPWIVKSITVDGKVVYP